MNLGDLEFKAEDFVELECYRGEGRPEPEVAPAVLARFCNTLLSERLAKAPEVGHRCRNGYSCYHERGQALFCKPKKFDTYRARLVCVEEVKR